MSVTETTERSIFGTPGSLEAAMGDYTVGIRSRGRFSSTRQLVEAHSAGDAEATEIWQKSLKVLARAITSFINILDPERVIIGGGITKAGPLLFNPLRDFVEEIEWRPADRKVDIVPAALGEWAGTYGAAWHARNSARKLGPLIWLARGRKMGRIRGQAGPPEKRNVHERVCRSASFERPE